mmetsp:Transcript_10969/g.16877  ORF Transcript_10969/g.16877 Transcript_10969/m.16877 type:complete len:182 (-) Transcript_10969:27-572(-)
MTASLPPCYQPTQYDVICGKGKKCYNHAGNKLFRKIVEEYLKEYSTAATKLDKSIIVSTIVHGVRTKGGFVKVDDEGIWHDVGDEFARERVGQTIRDMLHHQYRSSTTAKRKRRQALQKKSSSRSVSPIDFSFKIDQLRVLTESHTGCDRQLMDLFTQTNLDILNELNDFRESQPALVTSC